ncbi:hypothetical protein [Bdellovibrio sp. NC01]|uniref:hypothetical protein n=1 Tax=Bdellovibrio sp. NC01 TaxID=2220073 RepID=UPI001158AEA9|nr:hypothetical protein [Bdellovibrio sp. NC01]QDK38154.1 hypothetical protein DOE51_11445 [Bdellovibrio sp. NC01]
MPKEALDTNKGPTMNPASLPQNARKQGVVSKENPYTAQPAEDEAVYDSETDHEDLTEVIDSEGHTDHLNHY